MEINMNRITLPYAIALLVIMLFIMEIGLEKKLRLRSKLQSKVCNRNTYMIVVILFLCAMSLTVDFLFSQMKFYYLLAIFIFALLVFLLDFSYYKQAKK